MQSIKFRDKGRLWIYVCRYNSCEPLIVTTYNNPRDEQGSVAPLGTRTILKGIVY